MKAKKYKDINEMYQNAHRPCVHCKKGGIMGDDGYDYEYVCGASLKKYESCKHKEHIRNIHNIYMEPLIEALIKDCKNGGKE